MNYIKGGLKVLVGYLLSLLLFVVFFITFFTIAGDNYYAWLPVYSFIMFLIMFPMIYVDMKKLAVKEKRPQYNLNPYPLKGLVIGFIGFLPVILVELLSLLISFQDELLISLERKALNTIMGPLYFIIRLGRSTAQAYIIASLVVPFTAMIGYLAGYYGFEFRSLLKSSSKKNLEESGPKFTKSPWNPTANENSGKKKQKSK